MGEVCYNSSVVKISKKGRKNSMIHSGMTCDTAARTLLRDNEVFASLFNTVFFDGEEVIDYKTLVSYENDQSVLIDHQDIKRRRDIVKKSKMG